MLFRKSRFSTFSPISNQTVMSRLTRTGIDAWISSRLSNTHREEKFDVAAGLFQLVKDKFHRFDGRDTSERAAENDNLVVFVRVVKQFLFSRAGTLDVYRRENAAIHQRAIQMDFHIAGAFELFEDDFIHSRASIDERRGNDGQRAALLDIARCAKKPFRFVQV